MVTETDRNKARSAVVKAYNALDCVGMSVPFLHAFADAAVDAVSTDAGPVVLDDQDRTPMPAGFDEALWRKADEVHHAMALVARDQECVKIIYAALSTHNAEPVKTAPGVAVKDVAETDFKYRIEYDYRSYIEGKTMWGMYGELGAVTQEEAQAHLQRVKDHNPGNFRLMRQPILKWEEVAASPASKHGDAE